MSNNLLQARYLFEKAQMLWEPYKSITNGLVVGLLQDSAELVVWELAKAHSLQVKDQQGFVSILEKLEASGEQVHGKAQILEINKSRVAYKHYGLSPASSDIPRFIEGARHFLTENVRIHLGIDFNGVSLADVITDDETRNLIKEAERFRAEGNLEEALVQVSLAFQRVLQIAQQMVFSDLPRFDDVYRLFPQENQEAAGDLISGFEHFWARFGRNYAMFTLGVDQALLEELEDRRLTVNISNDGSRLGIYKNRKTTITQENINFLLSNVTDIARLARLPR